MRNANFHLFELNTIDMHVTDNKIFNTKNLEAGLFLLMGTAKTVHDYRSVGEKHKRRVLLNDVVVLSASSAGMLGYRALSNSKTVRNEMLKPAVEFCHKGVKKIGETDFVKKHISGRLDKLNIPLQSSIEYTKNIIGSCINNTAMVGAGLFSAILADYALTENGLGIHKLKNIMDEEDTQKPKQPKQLKQVENFMNERVNNVVSKDIRQEIFWRMTDFKYFSMLNSGFVGLAGLEITDNEKHSKQVKNASKYLLLNTMVPLFFFSIASSLTQKMKNVYRFPIMFTTLVAASLLMKEFVDSRSNQTKK